MTSVADFVRLAQRVQLHSPLYNTAFGLCMVRGEDPYEQTGVSGFWIARWQKVVLEAMLTCAINKGVEETLA